MNKQNLALATMIAISAITGTSQAILAHEQQKNEVAYTQPQWKNLCTTYATTLVAGGLIGTTTGQLSAHIISKTIKLATEMDSPEASVGAFAVILVTLFAESNFRKILTRELNDSFEEFSIKHQKNLVVEIARISSWIPILMAIK